MVLAFRHPKPCTNLVIRRSRLYVRIAPQSGPPMCASMSTRPDVSRAPCPRAISGVLTARAHVLPHAWARRCDVHVARAEWRFAPLPTRRRPAARTSVRCGTPRSRRRRARRRGSAGCWRPGGSRAARRRTGNSRPALPFAPQRLDHDLGLVRRHHRVLVALEEDHRLRQPIGVIAAASARDSAPPPADKARSASRDSAISNLWVSRASALASLTP